MVAQFWCVFRFVEGEQGFAGLVNVLLRVISWIAILQCGILTFLKKASIYKMFFFLSAETHRYTMMQLNLLIFSTLL